MRVSELAKELGKTSKEVLDILKSNNIEGKSHSSNVTEDQTSLVKRALGGGQTRPAASGQQTQSRPAASGAGQQAQSRPAASGAGQQTQSRPAASGTGQQTQTRPEVSSAGQQTQSGQTAAGTVQQTQTRPEASSAGQQTQSGPAASGTGQPAQSSGVQSAGGASSQGTEEPHKKKLAVAFRPQNSQQLRNRPQGGRPQGQSQGYQGGSRPQGQNTQQGARVQAQNAGSTGAVVRGNVQDNRDNNQNKVQAQTTQTTQAAGATPATPVRPQADQSAAVTRPQSQDNTAAPRPQSQDNTEAVRPQGSVNREGGSDRPQSQGYQGSREGGGYQGNRPQGQGYQGNREGGGYQGNRPQGQGYQGNRPQGQGYQGNRPQGQGYQGNREGGGYQGNRPQGQGYQGNREGGGYQGNRPQGQGYQGNREGGGYQGNRPQGQGYQGNREGGYQGNRPQGQGYQGNREGGGYQGNRPQGQGYQGNREGGGYQGNRPQGQGYQGNRPQGQGYQGNRPQGQGYQGNRDGGGYQGNRPQGGGYQGNRPQGGGYQGNRPQGGGYQGSRDGGPNRTPGGRTDARTAKPSFDSVIPQSKAQNNKQSKNAYKNDRYGKKDRVDDGKKTALKGGKGVKAPVLPPQPKAEPRVEEVKTIILPELITIKELAEKMKLQPSAIVKKLFLQGTVVTINQEVDYDKAEEIAMEFNVLCEKEVVIDVIEELLKEDEEDEKAMVSRPPVVCVMGHVDHGKTSLLDAIRKSNVTAREAGGITQHIGAYVVEINGQKITFLDTPGHEAFTAMRMRGAKSTDIAILVVAADDGVMPQTIEAINHAKAANVEIIVAINKIDKPSANVDKVKQELSEYELIPEDWGGSTIFVPVSAHTQEGIPELLEMILLAAEVKELKANPDRKARGLVIEAELDKGKGPVATILVQKGTLCVGDTVAAGACYGKVRAMMDDKGRRVKEAGPSTPVEILGLNDVPNAGEVFVATENEKEARNFAETFISEGKNKLLEDTKAKLSLDDLFSQIKAGNIKELPIVVKADVQGSVEAVKQSLLKLSNEEVMVKVIHGGVGAINESDVTLASASNAIIIGFNVRPDTTAKTIADREKVDLRLYKVIYQAIEDVEAAMKGMLDPIFEEKIIGHAVIRQTFKASGVGTIAGSYVLDGKFQRGCSVRITRDGSQIFDGPLASLKRFKDDVKEVNAGYECGLVFEKFNDVQEDDVIEAYAMVEVPR